MRVIKIIAGVVVAGVLALLFFALSEHKRAEYFRTKPMRDARHKKGQESEPEPEPEQEEEEEMEEERLADQQPIEQPKTAV